MDSADDLLPTRQRSRLWDYAVLAALVLVSFTRAPYILVQGRFWAEEGKDFFPAIRSAGLGGLFFVHPEAGYFTLLTNAVILVSSWFPLAIAPLITAWLSVVVVVGISFLFYCSLASHPRTGADPLLRTVAVLAPFALLIGPAAYPETWANSINLPHYLPILSFLLVVAYPIGNGRVGPIRATAPFFLAISSPYSALVGLLEWRTPAKSTRGVSRSAAIGATVGLGIQVAVFLNRWSQARISSERSLALSPLRVADNSAYVLSGSVLGQDDTLAFIASVERVTDPYALSYLLTSVLALGLFAALVSASGRWLSLATIYAVGVVILLVTVAAYQGVGRGRYTVASIGILVVATVFAMFGSRVEAEEPPARVRIGSVVLLALFLAGGVSDFWTMERTAFLDCVDCPNWRDEIARLPDRGEELVRLDIWPYPEWSMQLTGLRWR